MEPPDPRDEDDDEAREREQVAIALLLEIEEKRTGDSADSLDRSLALASPDGRVLTTLARSTQGLLGHHQARKDSLLLFYVAAGVARVLDVDPTTRTIRSDEPLATREP